MRGLRETMGGGADRRVLVGAMVRKLGERGEMAAGAMQRKGRRGSQYAARSGRTIDLCRPEEIRDGTGEEVGAMNGPQSDAYRKGWQDSGCHLQLLQFGPWPLDGPPERH